MSPQPFALLQLVVSIPQEGLLSRTVHTAYGAGEQQPKVPPRQRGWGGSAAQLCLGRWVPWHHAVPASPASLGPAQGAALPGIPEVMAETGVTSRPRMRRAFPGTNLSQSL